MGHVGAEIGQHPRRHDGCDVIRFSCLVRHAPA